MLKGLFLIVLGVFLLAMIGGGLFELVAGIVGGIFGLIAGLFGLVVGLIGGVIGIVIGVGAILFVIFLPIIIIGAIFKALVC